MYLCLDDRMLTATRYISHPTIPEFPSHSNMQIDVLIGIRIIYAAAFRASADPCLRDIPVVEQNKKDIPTPLVVYSPGP